MIMENGNRKLSHFSMDDSTLKDDKSNNIYVHDEQKTIPALGSVYFSERLWGRHGPLYPPTDNLVKVCSF